MKQYKILNFVQNTHIEGELNILAEKGWVVVNIYWEKIDDEYDGVYATILMERDAKLAVME